MNSIYPLKFEPILKRRIWGGSKLNSKYGKPLLRDGSALGESWELSAVEGDVSVVSNGFLAGNNLQEIIEVYMGDLVGDRVYEKFGVEFPLLVKLIDATDDLSIQVHPNDVLAQKLHHAWGKSEFWYILESDENAQIVTGFNRTIDPENYQAALNNGNLQHLLKYQNVKKHDSIFVPAGLVHGIGKGVVLVEIQQTSDVTYRIYDWDRTDSNGLRRELHTDLALKAIDFGLTQELNKHKHFTENKPEKLCHNSYFTVNRLYLSETLERSKYDSKSFTIYLCIEGDVTVRSQGNDDVFVEKGELVLVPAELTSYYLISKSKTLLLEIFIA